MYEQGDEVDDNGLTINRGGCPPELFRCKLCPTRIMPEPDEITQLANEVYAYMARYPIPEHMDLTFIFNMVGLRVGSEEAKDVWERLLDRLEVEREYRERKSGRAQTNGHQPQDMGPAS
jgi:hypothetical protein